MDWYAYWQAYELRELQTDIQLFTIIENTPDANERLTTCQTRLEELQAFSNDRIRSTKQRWTRLAPTFDWLSRYRTLLGNWTYHRLPWDALTTRAKTLAAELGLTEERLRTDIRDGLLTLWKDWTWQYPPGHITPAMTELLRDDIHRAFQFLSITTGTRIDENDPYFDPPDRNPRPWARPREVLPFESHDAKRSLPRTAPLYLTEANVLLSAPDRLTTEYLQAHLDTWWETVPAFGRFCINLHRLHQHYSPNTTHQRVLLQERTPIDYLLLTAISTERVLLHQHQAATGATDAPSFKQLLLATSDRLTTRLGIPSIRQDVADKWDDTMLHDLTSTRRNPFATANGLPKTTLPELLIAAFFDVAVMRNYAAHHDVLDDELITQSWGREPLQALLLITLLSLQP
jgi:hypothetical protein